MTWQNVKKKYMEFHGFDEFTEDMAVDIDFGFWLVNEGLKQNEQKEIPWLIDRKAPAHSLITAIMRLCNDEDKQIIYDKLSRRVKNHK